MNFYKLRSQKFPKQLVVIPIVLILVLSVMTFWLPYVYAASPTISFITSSTCGSPCGTSVNIFSALGSPNPSTIPGQGLIISLYCAPGGSFNYGYGTQPSLIVNSINDNVGDVWFQALEQTTVSPNGAYVNIIWFTNVIVTAATTLTVTANFVPYGFQCYSQIFESSTPLSIHTIGGNQVSYNVGTGGFQQLSFNTDLQTNSLSTPSNTLMFETTWISTSGGSETEAPTNYNSHVLLTNNVAGLTPPLNAYTYFLFNSVGASIPYHISWLVTSTKSAYTYPLGLAVIIFNITAPGSTTGGGGGSTCSGVSCGVSGGGTQLDSTTSFTITANTTYYYAATSGKGGLTINNVTSYVQSYTNAGGGKSVDMIMLAVYEMQGGTNIQNFSTTTFPLIRVFNTNLTINTGQTNKWLHGGTLNIGVPANTSYIVSILSKFSGLSIFHSTTAGIQMLQTTEGFFSGSIWSPPSLVTIQTPYANSLYLTWSGTMNPISVVQIVTSTSIFSCLAGSTCQTTTVTTWLTVTSSVNNLQGGSGATAITGNLIYYWPIWLLPMLFIPFGIQGVLVGFIFGDVIGAISGIVPLWAAFVLGLGTLYLLQRSRF